VAAAPTETTTLTGGVVAPLVSRSRTLAVYVPGTT